MLCISDPVAVLVDSESLLSASEDKKKLVVDSSPARWVSRTQTSIGDNDQGGIGSVAPANN